MNRNSIFNDPTLKELRRVGNFRQAIKNIDKRLKKHPKDIELLVAKADSLLCNEDYEACHQICQELGSRSPAVTDPELVERIHRGWLAASNKALNKPASGLDQLWLNALKAQTDVEKKTDLAERWADNAVFAAQWPQLVKAAAELSRLRPSDATEVQKYYFWQIVGQWLSKPNPSITDERLRELNKQMAVKMLEKVLTQTPRAVGHPSGISSRSQFDLLRGVFLDNGRDQQLLQAIEDKEFDANGSKAVDGWGVNDAKFQIYARQQNQQQAWALATEIIDNAKALNIKWRSDDWQCYQKLIENTEEDSRRQTLSLIREVESQTDQLRSPQLARLHLQHDAIDRQSSPEITKEDTTEQDDLITKAKSIFDQFGDQAGCSADLEIAIIHLNKSSLQNFRSQIQEETQRRSENLSSERDQLKWIARETNLLNLDLDLFQRYLRDDEMSTPNVEYLNNLIKQCLDLYRLSRSHTANLAPTDTGPGDTACVLVAKAFIQLKFLRNRDRYVMQAACVLIMLIEDSKHNFSARLMLINLLWYLGLPALALKYYNELGVKELLVESCCPMVFPRISTLYPFPTTTVSDPNETMWKSLRFYGNTLKQVPKHQMTALENENYVPCLEFDTFLDKIKNSPTRQMLVYERRRIANLRGIACDEKDTQLDLHPPTSLQDGTSWKQTMADKILIDQPPPMNAHAITATKFIGAALDLSNLSDTTAYSADQVDEFMSSVPSDAETITETEQYSLRWAANTIRLRSLIFNSNNPDPGTCGEQLTQLTSFIKDLPLPSYPTEPPLPHWSHLHNLTSKNEILRTTHGLLTQSKSRIKTLKLSSLEQAIVELQKLTRDRWNEAKAANTKLLERIQDLNLFDQAFAKGEGDDEDEMNSMVLEVVGEDRARRIMEELKSAAVEAVRALNQGLKGPYD